MLAYIAHVSGHLANLKCLVIPDGLCYGQGGMESDHGDSQTTTILASATVPFKQTMGLLLFLFKYKCMCACMHPQKQDLSGVKVIGSCELPGINAWNQT